MGRARKFTVFTMFLFATTVCVAGFFHADTPSAAEAPDVVPAARTYEARPLGAQSKHAEADVAHTLQASRSVAEPAGLSGLTFGSEGRVYERNASLSVRVSDVFDSLATIEKLVADAKGYLEAIDVHGTPSTHDGRLRLAIPSDRFTEVFGKLRQLGDVLAEQITAQMVTWNTRNAAGGANDEAIEIVRVDLTLSDNPERLAKTKIGAMMGTAWQKGIEHFAKGGAVLIEGMGYVLPFVLSFAAILIVVGAFGLVARLFGRLSSSKIPYAAPAE